MPYQVYSVRVRPYYLEIDDDLSHAEKVLIMAPDPHSLPTSASLARSNDSPLNKERWRWVRHA